MPALPSRRTSLCLYYAVAARARPNPQPLLPRIQVAHRSKPRGNPNFAQSAYHGQQESYHPRAGNEGSEYNRGPFHTFYAQFSRTDRTIREKLEKLRAELAQPDFLESLQLNRDAFEGEWVTFEQTVSQWTKRGSVELNNLVQEAMKGRSSLETRLRYMFYAQACGGRFTKAELANQKEVADLRYPAEWYPATREIPRTVHLHVGPTNSGKTYHALKRLEEAEKGIYLGPLRLLAHEVYTRLNAKGKPCALVTGEEQRLPEGETKMWSCTVEMAPLNARLDVAVIDEIQMINHKERGWAWTQALLGVQAREVHLCGEARTVPLIRELCALVGDKVHVHEYQRLTPLQVAPRSLHGDLNKLEKGDCVVAFSVLGIHALRKEIETRTNKKCAIVYGSLPPETRAQQALLFNDPNNDYDFLVASDAVGMGLNLSIKRVIFESTVKSNGTKLVPLQISEIKQIAGRAGRYRTAHQAVSQGKIDGPNAKPAGDPSIGLDDANPDADKQEQVSEAPTVGLATTLDQMDFNHLKVGMSREPEPIETAGIFPPSLIVERFANYFPPGTPFSYIMLRLHEISVIHPRFHLCGLKDQLQIADTIHPVKNLSISDRIIICATPINMRNEDERKFLRTLAECIADNTSGHLLELPNIPLEVLDEPPSAGRNYLYRLEQLHKMIVSYLWLSYRFPNVFTTRALANHAKQLTEESIEQTLMQFSWTEKARKLLQKKRKEAIRDAEKQQRSIATQEGNAEVAAPGELPEVVKDVLEDGQAFEEAPRTDDESEYPTEEFKILEPSEPEIRVQEKESTDHSQEQSSEGAPPPHLGATVESSTASQPRG